MIKHGKILIKPCFSFYRCKLVSHFFICTFRSDRVAERLALPTSDHGVTGSNPAGGKILPEPKRRFIAQNLSCSPFHRLEMTEILLKGRKTLTHPSYVLLVNVARNYSSFLNKYCNARRIYDFSVLVFEWVTTKGMKNIVVIDSFFSLSLITII